jgi:hypothetical protein
MPERGIENLGQVEPIHVAAFSMRIEDYFLQGSRGSVWLHEEGGKEHEMPTHHNLDHYLEEYIATDRRVHSSARRTDAPVRHSFPRVRAQTNVYALIR